MSTPMKLTLQYPPGWSPRTRPIALQPQTGNISSNIRSDNSEYITDINTHSTDNVVNNASINNSVISPGSTAVKQADTNAAASINNELNAAAGLYVDQNTRSTDSTTNALPLSEAVHKRNTRPLSQQFPSAVSLHVGYVYGTPEQWIRVLQGNIHLNQWPQILRRSDYSWQPYVMNEQSVVDAQTDQAANTEANNLPAAINSSKNAAPTWTTRWSKTATSAEDAQAVETSNTRQLRRPAGRWSDYAKRKNQETIYTENVNLAKNPNTASDSYSAEKPASTPSSTFSTSDLTAEEKQLIQQLKATDAEVRAHEAAHVAAGSGLTRGGVSYSYQVGPDGKRYAIGGEVSIDAGEETSPEQTKSKMQRVRAAALAPANPSPQDQAVAAAASQALSKAEREIAENRREALKKSTEQDNGKLTAKTSSTAKNSSNNLSERQMEIIARSYNKLSRPASEVIRATNAARAYGFQPYAA